MESLSKEKTSLLINNILAQAKYYLNEAGEFYPFGALINMDNSIQPIGIYFGEEYPDSKTVFNKLEFAIKQRVNENIGTIAAIGMDVYINPNDDSKSRKNAIQIDIYSNNSHSTIYFTYNRSDRGFLFQKENK